MEMFQKEPILGRSSTFVQVLSLLLIIVLSLLFIYLFALLLALPFWGKDVVLIAGSEGMDLSQSELVVFLKYIQTVSQFALFIFPSILFAYLVHRKVFDYLKLNTRFTISQFIISILLIYISLPFLSWMGELNQQMTLPSFLSGLEDWMRSSEETASRQVIAFLDVKTFGAILFNVFMIAIIPGIGEEFLFRGVLIRLFNKWFGNVHVAVIVSSILFSALHLQFYGFLPRFMLGLILGYTFVWTSSLWIPVLLHFFNNLTIIIAYYIERSNEIGNPDIEAFGSTDNVFFILISLIITVGLAYFLYQKKERKFEV